MTRVKSLALALLALGVVAGTPCLAAEGPKPPAAAGRVFELRTYYTHPGRLDALNTRFRDHTCKLFQKHGMELIGFWTPTDDGQGKDDTLVYLLAYPSRDAAKASWKAFSSDPDWMKAKAESEKDGPIVKKVESKYLEPTDYSAIK